MRQLEIISARGRGQESTLQLSFGSYIISMTKETKSKPGSILQEDHGTFGGGRIPIVVKNSGYSGSK